ncbi:MAG: hypothetical protein PVH64_13525, partial [Bacillota bacterium]
RYRIWLVKNRRSFYLETVRERVTGEHAQKWRVRPLSWLELTDQAAPPLPATTTEQTQEGDD